MLRQPDGALDHDNAPGIGEVNGDVRIGERGADVHGGRQAAVVEEIVDPQPVDRHYVRASARSVRCQPVLTCCDQLSLHIGPRDQRGGVAIAVGHHECFDLQHLSRLAQTGVPRSMRDHAIVGLPARGAVADAPQAPHRRLRTRTGSGYPRDCRMLESAS